MNMKIDKVNGEIAFNEEYHKYFNIKYPGLDYISVTTIIGKYYEHFNEDFFSFYKAVEKLVDNVDLFKEKKGWMLERQKYFNDNLKNQIVEYFELDWADVKQGIEDLLAQWKATNTEACEIGTAFHLERENEWYEKYNDLVRKRTPVSGNFTCAKHNFDLEREKAVIPEFLAYFSCPEKVLNLAGQVDLLIKDGNDIYILDYKGLPLDTLILTVDGFKELKDITTSDIIYDKNGKQTQIKNISEIHNNPCYEIYFDNGESIVADHEHRWDISFRNTDKTYRNVVMTTEELEVWINTKPKESYYIPKIRNPKPLINEYKELPLDPYILGAWLGDGSKSCGIITNVNPDFWNEVAKRGYEIGKNLSDDTRAEMRTVYGISTTLKSLGLINNKHIPSMYLTASYEQRLDLLRGLMDTDGYYNKKRKRFVMTTTQEWQVHATVQIAGTLGIKTTVFPCTKQCGELSIQGWDICFWSDVNPFLIRNQYDLPKPKTDKHSFRNIVKVIKTDTVETKCLEVESDTHTFLYGESLIVTHNTNAKGIQDKAFFDRKTKSTKKMFYPLNNLDDTVLNHYTLQLSTYAYMLKRINPDFNIKMLKLIHIDREGNETEFEVPYLEEEVKRMLVHYKRQIKIEKAKAERV